MLLRMKFFFAILLALAFCIAGSRQGKQGQRYALLVGVDEYEQSNFIHPLNAAGADAEELGKALVDVGGFASDHVRVLTSKSGIKPTNTNILYELEQLGKRVKPGDTVFFFFSGHGIQLGDETYLLPSNTDAREENTLRISAVPTSMVQRALSRLPAENLVLAFDMCRTDPLKSDRDADPRQGTVSEKQVKDLVMTPVAGGGPGPRQITTFFSCSPGQKSYEWRSKKRGYFSFYFEQALRGQAADPATGEVRIGELQSFVRVKVEGQVKADENSDQVPYIKLEGPDPIHMTISRSKPTPPVETGGAVKEKSTIATMRFTVLDKDGKPVPNPTVTVDGNAGGLESTLNLEDQRTRDVEVTVKADGFIAKVLQVTLERGKETPVEVKLEARPGEGPPRGSSGAPAKGARKRSAKGNVEMVYVPEGEFTMGSGTYPEEKPVRKVFLDGYWMGLNDVTVAQFRAYTSDPDGYRKDFGADYNWEGDKPSWGWKDDHPMVKVKWEEARAYCAWAGGDLPTEAQWEKAARGDDSRNYPWGNEWSTSKLWCSKISAGDAKSTAPVGSFPSGASPYGCLDMTGNVWQWCLDCYGDYDSSQTRNPKGVGFGDSRVLRGGNWTSFDPVFFRCALRFRVHPTSRGAGIGFRLAGRF